MEKDNDFETVLLSSINDSVPKIKTSKDIFEEGWAKKEQRVSRKSYSYKKPVKKVIAPAACITVFSLDGVFSLSPEVRASAQKLLTVFLPDESGNIVEKAADEAINSRFNVGGIFIDDKNKKEMENKYGFTFNFPENLGEYSIDKAQDGSAVISTLVSGENIKYEEEENLRDEFMKANEDDKTFEELSKDYKVKRAVATIYENNQGHKFYFYLSKSSSDSDKKPIKELNIDNVKCTVLERAEAEYEKKKDDKFLSTDLTKEPAGAYKNYYLQWNYEGVNYSICVGRNSSDIDAAKEFAGDYLKILKSK